MKPSPGYIEHGPEAYWWPEDSITKALRAVPVPPVPPGGGDIPAHVLAFVEGLGASYRASTGTNPFAHTLDQMRGKNDGL